MRTFFLLLLLPFASNAFAKGDTKGMCLKQNEVEEFVAGGWCKTIFETIGAQKGENIEKGCTDQLFQKLAQKAKTDGYADFHHCNSDVVKDKQKFQEVFAAYLSAMIHVVSQWKSNESGETRGVLPMTLSSAQTQGCGCENIKDKITLEDENLSSKCVTAIVMNKLLEQPKQGEQPKGLRDKLAPIFGKDFKGEAGDKTYKKINEKMDEYCKKFEKGGAPSIKGDFEEDLRPGSPDTDSRTGR